MVSTLKFKQECTAFLIFRVSSLRNVSQDDAFFAIVRAEKKMPNGARDGCVPLQKGYL